MIKPKDIFRYQLYLLQAEGYELGRYWQLLHARGFSPRGPLRLALAWTSKAKLLAVLGVALHLLASLVVFSLALLLGHAFLFSLVLGCAFLLIGTQCYPAWFSAALLILSPIDALAKYRIVAQAQAKLRARSNLHVIAIAGSYGKTTMKHVLQSVLQTKLRVAAPGESVNTPVGIARWIVHKLPADAEVVIIEMGEHYPGDVAELCRLAPPDIAVLTGVNAAHAERLGNVASATATILEAADGVKSSGVVIYNADDERICKAMEARGKEKNQPYGWKSPVSPFRAEGVQFDANALSLSFALARDGSSLGQFTMPFLAEYAIGVATAALIVAEHLGLSRDEVARALAQTHPVEHRLQPIKNAHGILVIDDSYNGNPDGVREAIGVLKRFEGRRKLYLTPGLVEMGSDKEEIHRSIGRELAPVADLVLLINTSVSSFIKEGLLEAGFKEAAIRTFKSAPEAHTALRDILVPGDVIVFQNDWGDNYV